MPGFATLVKVSIFLLALGMLTAGCSWTTAAEKDNAAPPAADLAGKTAGEERSDNGLKMKFVWCPPGKFQMGTAGSKNDESAAEVELTQGFWLGKLEVTQGEWERIQTMTPYKKRDLAKVGADFPVSYVSWNEAVEFCQKFTAQEQAAGRLPKGWGYSLPTEAQWEYACRSGSTTKYSFGNDERDLGTHAWWGGYVTEGEVPEGNARPERYPHRVGQKKPNRWGLHDMHGNVMEHCWDTYREELPGGRDPVVVDGGFVRVQRGGSWMENADRCRSAARDRAAPVGIGSSLGFRVALKPL